MGAQGSLLHRTLECTTHEVDGPDVKNCFLGKNIHNIDMCCTARAIPSLCAAGGARGESSLTRTARIRAGARRRTPRRSLLYGASRGGVD